MSNNEKNHNAHTAEQVLETIGYEGFVRALFNRSGDPAKDFAHAIMGIVTEVHEYLTATDYVNAVEEAGDLRFYVFALGIVIGDYVTDDDWDGMDAIWDPEATETMLTSLNSCSTAEAFAKIVALCASLLDEGKRWVGYGKPPKTPLPEVFLAAANLAACVTGIGRAAQASDEQVELVNVKKLLTRYNGMTFSAERAMDRDLGAERKVLEDAAPSH